MARTPFYGRNDTKIAKMDMQAATAPGRAYRDAFENLGKVGADVLNKFREAKKEKQEEEDFVNMGKQMPWESFKAFGVENEDERDAFLNRIKKKDTREQAINLVKFSTEQQQAQELSDFRALQKDQIAQNMARQKSADQLVEEERNKAQTQAQSLNRFLQTGGSELLQTNQGQDLYNRMVQSGVNPQTAFENVKAFEQRIAQSQPKAPTINELIALERRAEEVEEKTQLKESEEQQRQSLLAETNDILGIIESGKDVTGQVEGLDFVRALKKSVGYGKEDEKLRRKLERYANKFTLENVSKLKGPLSEKELAFIQQSSPKITDEPEVWVDFLTGLKDQLNTEGAGQIPQVDSSTPASQSILDEIERKKQLRSKRAGL